MSGNVERLFSLVQMLLEARRPVPLDAIRAGFPEYRDAKDATFHKMFERDKAAIRDLGFEVVYSAGPFGEEPAYTIDREASLVADPGLTAEEAAALGLAVAGASGEGALGAMKLSMAAGVASPGGWSVSAPAHDPRVAVLSDAIARRKRVRFLYRAMGAEPERREVEPHHLRARGGWYLSGHDTGRGEQRTFRLSRIEGKIVLGPGPGPDFEPAAAPPTTPHAPWEGEAAIVAEVVAGANAAWWIERRGGGTAAGDTPDGRAIARVPVADAASFAAWIAGFGTEAVVAGPPELRAAVIAHLRSVS